MNYRLIYEKDGELIVVTPSPRWCLTNQYNMKALAEKMGLSDYRIVNIKDLPKNRKFRSAWTLVGDVNTKRTTIGICPERARACIRAVRNKRLEELDKEAFAAQRGSPSKLEAIDTEAQRLRDLPSKFTDNIKQLEELLASIKP